MNIRMGTKGKRPLRSLTPSDKVHAIQRIHDGESKASVARDIGVPESTLRGWCKNEDKLRFMSRQSAVDKMCADSLVDKLDGTATLLGPPEKRQRLDTALPLNFSNKMKFDELTFQRSPLNGLDYSTHKSLTDLNYNGLNSEYVGYNEVVKNKAFGADITRPADPSLTAISPLSSLTHFSGLTGISQSPLAISFNELTSNLNLLAQLNPSLAAMSGLNNYAASGNTLRNNKLKPQSQIQSPQSENGERTIGLTVKNWAKQKHSVISSMDGTCGLNLSSQNDAKNGTINSSNPLAPSHIGNGPPLPLSGLSDDPLFYWLKSQQAIIGLNSLYPSPVALGVGSPPMRSSTPQHLNHHSNTPPIPSAPLTPSSTPSGSLDEKNSTWYNWCKAFGASLHSLNPNATTLAALQANSVHTNSTNMGVKSVGEHTQPLYENILYSHLTKESESVSVHSSSTNDHNQMDLELEETGKPEDLSSAKSVKTTSPTPSPILISAIDSPSPSLENDLTARSVSDPIGSDVNSASDSILDDCKDVLDGMLFKIGNMNPNTSKSRKYTLNQSVETSHNSEVRCINNNPHLNNNDVCANNNNNNSNETDEEERIKFEETANEDIVALRHGEKFLQWLENCSNPRVTTVQLMQLRFLIAAIKSNNESNIENKTSISCKSVSSSQMDSGSSGNQEESGRNKLRRRK